MAFWNKKEKSTLDLAIQKIDTAMLEADPCSQKFKDLVEERNTLIKQRDATKRTVGKTVQGAVPALISAVSVLGLCFYQKHDIVPPKLVDYAMDLKNVKMPWSQRKNKKS